MILWRTRMNIMWTGLLLGTLGAISTDLWPVIWIIMELNLISFLPLIGKRHTSKKIRLLYFITQSVGTLLILTGGILLCSFLKWVLLGLLLKGSFAPFHFWGLIILPNINWTRSFVFLTWQKVTPVCLLFATVTKRYLVVVVLLNVIFASLCRVGSKSLIILLFFSGLMQAGWIFSSSFSTGVLYLFYYIILIWPIFVCLDRLNLSLQIFNLAGLPPFTGFLLKLEVLTLAEFNLGVLLLFSSLFMLYSYLRVFLFSMSNGALHWLTAVVLFIGIL